MAVLGVVVAVATDLVMLARPASLDGTVLLAVAGNLFGVWLLSRAWRAGDAPD
jgi:hypothetical protein